MAGRSYLRRIAAPLTPREPVLAPLRPPLAEEARPAMQTASADVLQRRPSAVSARAVAHIQTDARESIGLTAPPVTLEAIAPARSDSPAVALPPASIETAHSSAPPQAELPEFGSNPSLPDIVPSSARVPVQSLARAATLRPSVRIGTVEVRTGSAPAAPPPPAAPPRAAPAAPSQPLSRSLAWRYGLVQS
jgi:hypothetical protein